MLGIKREAFDAQLDAVKSRLGVASDPEVPAAELRKLVEAFKDLFTSRTGHPFPQDPREQLRLAINAVFDSWFAKKAVKYRRINSIPAEWGTAVNVQPMVFGNIGAECGTGVCFTRDPNSGENLFYGDYLINAQGEDVVAGIRTPEHIEIEEPTPEIYEQLVDVRRPPGKALQGHAGHGIHRRGGQAVHAAVPHRQALAGGLLPDRRGHGRGEAHPPGRRAPAHQGQGHREALLPLIDPSERERDVTEDACWSPGSTPSRAPPPARWSSTPRTAEPAKAGQVILVRKETSPEDVGGMHAAEGILTATGGKTSHAAVVARGWGKCCIVGCGGTSTTKTGELRRGRPDGPRGRRDHPQRLDRPGLPRRPAPDQPEPPARVQDPEPGSTDPTLKVRTNADTPYDAARRASSAPKASACAAPSTCSSTPRSAAWPSRR